MPLLNCLATTCSYNKDEYCMKETIQVGGRSAKTSEETCCTSFREKMGDSITNAYEDELGKEKEETGVECKACECVYNEQECCVANKIGIAGSRACDCQDTECSTFSCGCK